MKCNNCIHNEVCLHKANIQTDTYAYMGVKYDTESCEHFEPKFCTDKQNKLRHCEDCHEGDWQDSSASFHSVQNDERGENK